MSIGHPFGSIGTLGGFVHPVGFPDDRHLLATATVIWPAGAREGDYIHQPGPRDVVTLTGETRAARLGPQPPSTRTGRRRVDAAAARLLPTMPVTGNVVPGWAPDAGLSLIVSPGERPRIGDIVGKLGRGTGYTRGRLTGKLGTLHVQGIHRSAVWKQSEAWVDNVLQIEGENGPFSGPGDSGAVIYRVEDGLVLGIVFASLEGEDLPISFGHPIDHVLSALGAAWV